MLTVAEANKEFIRVDPLQRLHTLHNLGALLGPSGSNVAGVPRTLRDDQLLEQAEAIRQMCNPDLSVAL